MYFPELRFWALQMQMQRGMYIQPVSMHHSADTILCLVCGDLYMAFWGSILGNFSLDWTETNGGMYFPELRFWALPMPMERGRYLQPVSTCTIQLMLYYAWYMLTSTWHFGEYLMYFFPDRDSVVNNSSRSKSGKHKWIKNLIYSICSRF